MHLKLSGTRKTFLGKWRQLPRVRRGNTRRFRGTRKLDHCITAKIQGIMPFKNRNTFLFLFTSIDMFYRFWSDQSLIYTTLREHFTAKRERGGPCFAENCDLFCSLLVCLSVATGKVSKNSLPLRHSLRWRWCLKFMQLAISTMWQPHSIDMILTFCDGQLQHDEIYA